MIHELEPRHFNNSYRLAEPKEGDMVISMHDGRILLAKQDDVSFPCYEELPEEYCDSHTFTYLFSIDDMRFFLCRDLEMDGYHYDAMQSLRGAAPQHMVYAGLVGMQLGRWYDAHKYCGRCGALMEHDEKERMMYCPACGQMEYPKICPCAIVGVIHDGKILVSQYRGGFTNHYALIAGFAEIGETIEDTARREVFEETHVHIRNLRYYKCQPWPFSESLLFGFYAELDGSDEITIQEDELSMAKWVTPEEIYETPDNFALTNEMLCKFKANYGKPEWEEMFR
ncbi:MAG: NAD(+) diphosphatase [Clostridiales bacterium]|nr:NAD(+) diphosphatase [Clostridiales bacterium]